MAASRGRSTWSLGFALALSRAETSFIALGAVVLAAISMSFPNSATETGLRLRGEIRGCTGRRTGFSSSRQCVVRIDAAKSVVSYVPIGQVGDVVTVIEMKHHISDASYYTAVLEATPNYRLERP